MVNGNDGNGQLIGTGEIFVDIGASLVASAETNVMKFSCYCRLEQVNTMEFVGIVQSQTTNNCNCKNFDFSEGL
jgi:hypothetical protein